MRSVGGFDRGEGSRRRSLCESRCTSEHSTHTGPGPQQSRDAARRAEHYRASQPPRQQPYKFLPGAITLAFVAAFAVVMLIITMATH